MPGNRLLAAAVAALTLSGCHFGPSTQSFGPAQQPAGVSATIELAHGTMDAELLAMRDTGIVVLNQGQVVLIPYSVISYASFDDVSETIKGGRSPSTQTRAALAKLSRFPQGLSPAIEAQLLAAHHQNEIVVAEP